MKKKKNYLRPNVVSFRLTSEQFKKLEAVFKASPVSYVKSEAGLARKMVCDVLAGRMNYVDKKHALIDVDAHVAG